jgi:carbon-monoxide dehydrogenase small subunit
VPNAGPHGNAAARTVAAAGLGAQPARPDLAFPTETRNQALQMSTARVLGAFHVNGERREVSYPPHHTLLEVLREELALTGTKHGCELGECGACTVLVDGVPVLSCLVLALAAEGRAITTVEGLASGPRLHPLQDAFADLNASQCGYCSSGILLTAKALLDRSPDPTREEIKQALAGNICRCTGYLKIFEAVELAAARLRGEPAEPTQETLRGH